MELGTLTQGDMNTKLATAKLSHTKSMVDELHKSRTCEPEVVIETYDFHNQPTSSDLEFVHLVHAPVHIFL